MGIRDIAQGKLSSNITPIARMGAPVRSAYSRAAEIIQTPDAQTIGYAKGGNWLTGISNALKSGLGFYGSIKDAENQKAYNEALAQMAEQERQDKLAQQQAEMDYKNRALAQQADLAQKQIENQAALQASQFANQKELEGIKNANALALQKAQLQAAIDAENRKRAYEEEQMTIKQLDPSSQQQYYQLKKQGKTPVIVDNKVGTIGKIFGSPKYSVSDGQPQAVEMPQMPALGLSSLFDYGRKIRALNQQVPQVQAEQQAVQQTNRAAFDKAWGK